MHTALFTHPACLEHDTGEDHPECIARLRAVLNALEGEIFMFLDRQEAPAATREQLERIHPPAHVDQVLAMIPTQGSANIDSDTVVCPASGEAALRAAGAVCAAIDFVVAGHARNAFCAIRPPGHHAEPDKAMGFCLFNNIAVGAAHAQKAHGLKRVVIVDFDVHHGNGTQTVAESNRDIFYGSTHQWPLYPGTGAAHERGPADNVVNACLPPMAGSPEFRAAVSRDLLPAIDAFKPDIILISAGFDAHSRDPLAGLHLMEDDFAWITTKLGELADKHCKGRLVSALEGGYDLRALASSAAAHVKALMAV